MKIGIITFHYAHNYGAVLQAYALSTRLCLEGYDAKIIDLKENTRAQNEVLIPETKEETEIPSKIDENMILGSINEEEKYVKYHIHTVTMNDSIESITKEYNISLNTLKKYNTFENLELNMKLLIPDEES